MKRLIVCLTLLLSINVASAAENVAPLQLGVLAYRPEPLVMAQWLPLADYLRQTLERPIELKLYNHAELAAATKRGEVDIVITTPNHFILLYHTIGLSAPLATLIIREGPHRLNAYGGVFFTRAERNDLVNLSDLGDQRIAAASEDAFGSYQMQMFELLEADLPIPAGNRLLLTGLPQERIVEAVLAGRADVGCVRAGLLEILARAGKLDLNRVKVINRQVYPDFPYAVSTRLYPEWPVAVMPHIDRDLASRLAAALFLLPQDSFTGSAASISGFGIPSSYVEVENLLRRLRLPPFDQPPEMTIADLWQAYAAWILSLAVLLLLLTTASVGLLALFRRSRASLREMERLAEQEKLLLASLAEGVYGVDTEGRCIFINPQALTLLGRAEEDLIGRDTHSLFHRCRDDGSPNEQDNCPIWRTLRDGVKRQEEGSFMREDGSIFPVSLVVSAVRQSNEIIGAVVAFQDITERKRAEDAYRNSASRFVNLFNKAAIPLCFVNKEGATLNFNAQFEKLFGYTRDDVPTLDEWWQRAYPDPVYRQQVQDMCNASLQRAIENMTDIEPIEYRVTCKNGDIRTTVALGSFIESDLLLTFFDITDRKKAEEALESSQKALRRLNAELERRVKERTAALEAKTVELESANKLFVGRELRMVELKEQLKKLKGADHE